MATAPVELGAFDRATERPDEPLTAGMAMGPGPGPDVLGMGNGDPVADDLRAIYLADPNPDLRGLIEDMEAEGR